MLGIALRTSQRQPILLDTEHITTSGLQQYTVPAGTQYIEIEMWGGGGGGGAGGNAGGRSGTMYQAGGGGGGGGYVKHRYNREEADLNEGDSLHFFVGKGGKGSSNISGTNEGGVGEATTFNGDTIGGLSHSFSTIPSAGGGGGGLCAFAFSWTAGGEGGESDDGNMENIDGEDGTARPSQSASIVQGVDGGDAGGGGGGAGGGAGSCVTTAGHGSDPGGGGGGGAGCITSPLKGGNGAAGEIMIRAYG